MALPLIPIALTAGLGTALWVRYAPMDADIWHLDPATVEAPSRPNFALRRGDEAPIYDAPLAEVAETLDRIALATPNTERLAGSALDGHVTYVSRSALLRYPDAISIRLEAVEGGTQLTIFSRSRFGYSDMGVNAARVADWLSRLEVALRQRDNA